MKYLLAALMLVAGVAIAADVPYYLRSLEGQRDLSALNENFRSLVSDITAIYTKWMEPKPVNGKALCLSTTTGNVSGCTSAIDASGNCTCP